MKPIIIDNILNDKEHSNLLKLCNTISNEPVKFFEKSRFDRHSIHRPLPLLSVAKRLKPVVENILNLKLECNIAMISCYKEGGKCPPHKDTEENEFGLAICVKKNLDWPFFVESDKFNIQENQGILFNGYSSTHYREGILESGDLFCVAFLHFRRQNEKVH